MIGYIRYRFRLARGPVCREILTVIAGTAAIIAGTGMFLAVLLHDPAAVAVAVVGYLVTCLGWRLLDAARRR